MRNIVLSILCFFILIKSNAQQDLCKCNKTSFVNVCYLSVEEYCYNNSGCNHALDGDFMRDYLQKKLLNPANFGENGISKCRMVLKKMLDIKSTTEINDAKCDIFFVGSFAVDTISKNVNSDKTSVPNNVLQYIKNWSLECESNLVVVSQAEAKPWGYTISNANKNPNTAISDPSNFSIFDNKFGVLTKFLQGGSYQGVITKIPATGCEVLAKDANNKPTVAFDKATKDFILGDIGIMCGVAGSISQGPWLDPQNTNDILAANIFALACDISTGLKFSDEDVYICQGKDFTLPNGKIVNKVQVVSDTFLAHNGCDSIHFTKVFFYPQGNDIFYKDLCKGDTFKYKIGSQIFDESNKTGTGILLDQHGCDSIITVTLNYFPTSKFSITEAPCINTNYSLKVGSDLYSETKRSGISILKNSYGCDSTVTVKLNFRHPDSSEVYFKKCINDTIDFDGINYLAGNTYSIKYITDNPCDSFVILTIDTFPSAKFNIIKDVEMNQYDTYTFKNTDSKDISEILWENSSGLSCNNCINPTFEVTQFPANFIVNIKDLNQCDYKININAHYNCGPIIPNAFAPNSAGINNQIKFSTDCPITGFSAEFYDRYGNKVFKSTNSNDTWDGTFNGRVLMPGVYTFKINYNSNNKDVLRYGNVTILR